MHLPWQMYPSGQTLPQAPQLFWSKTTLVHTPLQQRSSGDAQSPASEQAPGWTGEHVPSTQFCPAGQCSFLLHLPGFGLAQATPGTEAKAAPTIAPHINRNAWRREMVPLASTLASSSKDRSLVVSWVVGTSPSRPSAGMRLLLWLLLPYPTKAATSDLLASCSQLHHWLPPPQVTILTGRSS